MKLFYKLITSIVICCCIFLQGSFPFIESSWALDSLVSIGDLGNDGRDIRLSGVGQEGIQKTILNLAESLKNIFYVIATIYFIIISIKLIVTSNTDDEVQNFKKGILWITIGIIVMNLATFFVGTIYSGYGVESTFANDINLGNYAEGLLQNLAYPIIKVLETATAFFFVLVALFAFFRLITANGNDEEVRRGKMTILYAVIGFILVIIAAELVFSVYGSCTGNLSQVASILGATCNNTANLEGTIGIIVNIIGWLNSFVAVIVILMIIYAGGSIMLSGGEEDKITNAKKSIIYIIIGIGILVVNYFLLTFFIK